MSSLDVNEIRSVDGQPVRFPNGINTAPRNAIIGAAGEIGFGIGAFHNSARYGLFPLAGAEDIEAPTYGNYQSSNGSIFGCIPKCYYRIGHPNNDTYGTYGHNSIQIEGADVFVDQAAANANGFAMPRSFIDGGRELAARFVSKYLCSRDGDSVLSIPNAVPISLTTSGDYTNSADMPGCSGILADAITLSRLIIPGHSHCMSAFDQSLLALLMLAHAQASTSASACAWFDGTDTMNFVKGCNDNALGDTNDPEILYATAGDAGSAAKPLTGSGAPFAKTTHNGQASGIADLNGLLWQVLIGITAPGSTATDTAQLPHGDVYVLKESVSLASLTGGHNGATDAWGDAAHLATLYDARSALLPWADATDRGCFGNGASQVFDEALSGDGWLRTNAGIPQDTDAMSASGSNLFGQDGNYRYNRSNMCVRGSGPWGSASAAGVFYRHWNNYRSPANDYSGFRASVPAFG